MEQKYVLNIHLENPNDLPVFHFKQLMDFIGDKAPILVSLVPSQIAGFAHDINFDEELKKIILDFYHEGRIIPVQQGYQHHCMYCFDEKENKSIGAQDPFHEFDCLYYEIPKREQENLIHAGKTILTNFFGQPPSIFTAPNHLNNKDTLEVLAEQGFEYMTERALVDFISPYKVGAIKILPEIKGENGIDREKGIVYIHNDKINRNVMKEIYPHLVSLENYLKDEPNETKFFYELNKFCKECYKAARDITNFPRYIMKSLIKNEN